MFGWGCVELEVLRSSSMSPRLSGKDQGGSGCEGDRYGHNQNVRGSICESMKQNIEPHESQVSCPCHSHLARCQWLELGPVWLLSLAICHFHDKTCLLPSLCLYCSPKDMLLLNYWFCDFSVQAVISHVLGVSDVGPCTFHLFLSMHSDAGLV